MEYIVLLIVIFILIALIMVKGFLDEKKKQKKFVEWLKDNYGVLPKREAYKPEEMEKIARYYSFHKTEEFQIDDITWNDLNMDKVFQQMNYTYSAAGEEYLYYLLRTPMQKKEQLERLEGHVKYFTEHKEERVQYQTVFAQIGKTGKYSIYDYLHYLELLGERSNRTHYLGNLSILLALLIMVFSVEPGIVLVVGTISANIVRYFKIKKQIEPYITSFGYIFRLLNNVEEIEKRSLNAFEEEIEELRAGRKKMTRFKSGSYILMASSGMSASANILETLLDYVRMVFHLDLIKFNNMLAEVQKNIGTIDRMLTIIGYMETTIAIGNYRAAKSCWCQPEFDRGIGIKAENMYHPLVEMPVKNSIMANRGVLLTGSNASGKSTFLKTVAINAILAQTIHTCLADSYSGGMFRVMTSMALKDDLIGGDSYFIVEIKSLKRILNEAQKQGNPVLCFVDEVLRGTNTVERIAASAQILRSLTEGKVLCFAATHDIELTHLLEEDYNNYHFEEEISKEDVIFNYQLKKGRATSRNAIKLLGVMGYDEKIIREAERMAEGFLETGFWNPKK